MWIRLMQLENLDNNPKGKVKVIEDYIFDSKIF